MSSLTLLLLFLCEIARGFLIILSVVFRHRVKMMLRGRWLSYIYLLWHRVVCYLQVNLSLPIHIYTHPRLHRYQKMPSARWWGGWSIVSRGEFHHREQGGGARRQIEREGFWRKRNEIGEWKDLSAFFWYGKQDLLPNRQFRFLLSSFFRRVISFVTISMLMSFFEW